MDKIKFSNWPIGGKKEIELLTEVVESGKWWRMNGDKVLTFEKKFAEYHNSKYCLGVANGTLALELALAALDIQAGDEIIVPAFTFISTFSAPINCDAIPVPVDVDEDTFCIDPTAIENAITEKTKAIIPVHMAGQMCDMDAIFKISKKYNLKIIEDAAHAHGAKWRGFPPGSFSDIAIFSFQNGKIMTCGEGGALITNNKRIYEKLCLLHGVGRPLYDKGYNHLVLGTNARMNEFQAAVLLAQLERLQEMNKLREKNAKFLDSKLGEIEGIKVQKVNPKAKINTHYMYMFYFDSREFNGITRDEFVDLLNSKGIPAFVAYPVVCNTRFFKEGNFRGHIKDNSYIDVSKLKNSEKISKEVVWLPHYVLLSGQECLEAVVASIENIKKGRIEV